MDWSVLFTIFSQFGVSWIGNPALAGIFWTAVIIIAMSRLGLGFEVGTIVGMGFLMLFSVFMLPMDLMWLVVIIAGSILALAIMKIMGR